MGAARVAAVAAAFVMVGSGHAAASAPTFEVRTLDGGGNNLAHPQWGQVGRAYLRVAAANYADGVAAPVTGPPTRYVSNRVFNDSSQNLFSENGVTQWGFAWGQFMDHTFGLREEVGGERAPIAFSTLDPLEAFRNDFGAIDFSRTPAAPGTGTGAVAREQINTVGSYIDGWTVYGGTNERLEWMLEGPVDGNLANNGARLLLPGGLLPLRSSRGNTATAPAMALQGRLGATPDKAVVAGDVRANENLALTATHTLFAREHNRIVDALPADLPEELKFQIARRVVGAEQQFITYTEFLPALGVRLSPYAGYDPNVDATLSNEFAVVGYRAHSMIHGELEPEAPAGTWSEAQLAAFHAQGIEVEEEDGETVLVIPLNLAFGNPELLVSVGLAPALAALGAESQYRNDEMIDNQLRSVLFEVPRPGIPDPSVCLDGPPLPDCFTGVQDLGAIDIERGRDHGMPSYNDLRRAYGLAPKLSFAAITGEPTEAFTPDPLVDPANPIDDPDILDFVELFNVSGYGMELGGDEGAVSGVRRSTLAARLKALYGDVAKVDAFTGMVAEPHVLGTEFGELQLAIWKKQFQALRDGDRFFYLNDPALAQIEQEYGISARHTLAEIITANTGLETRDDVFTLGNVIRHEAGAGATVPATLSLALGPAATFGTFTPGVARDYRAGTTANVISTAGSATLSVADPSPASTGHLVNGSRSLSRPLQAAASNAASSAAPFAAVGGSASPTALLSFAGPVSNDAVTIDFQQTVTATDPLRTGSYAKTLAFTLSTTEP